MTGMDTKAINEQLERLSEDENCVLISTKIYSTINSVQREYPGLKLLHKPLSIIHPTYLNLLASTGIEIVCPNMEVLGGLKKAGTVSSDLLTEQLISASSALGCTVYQCSDLSTARAIAALCPDAALDLVVSGDRDMFVEVFRDTPLPFTGLTIDMEMKSAEDVCQIGELIHTLLEIAGSYGHDIRTVSLGVLAKTGNTGLHHAVQALAGSLVPHITPGLTLAQDIFTESLILAARVLERDEEEGGVSYTVDLSMYAELAMYLDTNTIYTDGTTTGVIRGNSYDDDDVIVQGLVPDTPDWILLRGVALADFRGFNLYLLDSEERIVCIEEEVTVECHCSSERIDVPAPIIVM